MILDVYDLLTLGTTTTTLSDGFRVSNDDIATTLATSITSASNNNGTILEIRAASAREYVSSMSVEEIDDMLLEIEKKEISLENNGGKNKVKQIGSIEKKI